MQASALKLNTAQGELKDDPTFGPTEIYHHEASAYIEAVPEKGEVLVTFQGCGENTICYPADHQGDRSGNVCRQRRERKSGIGRRDPTSAENRESSSFGAAELAGNSGAEASGWAAALSPLLLTFLGFGLLLAFTPCIFPMLPILSGMLTQSAGRLSLGRGFALSASYVLAMASAYGVLGIFAAWFGGNLQATLQTPLAVTLMSALFVVLALSMFGLL